MKLEEAIKFLGVEVVRMLVFAIATGLFLFVIEYCFVFSLQGFLISIGVMQESVAKLPNWYPLGTVSSLSIFVIIGLTRSILLGLKTYIGGVANQAFLRLQRENIFALGMRQNEAISSHEVFGLFSDTLSRSGSAIISAATLLITLTMTVFLAISGFWLAPKEMLIGLAILILMMLPTKLLNKIVSSSGKGLDAEWKRVSKLLLEGVKHNLFFHAHGLVEDQIKSASKSIRSYEAHYRRFFFFSAIKNALPNLAGIVLLCVLSFISLRYFETDPSNLLAFLYIFLRIGQGGSEIFVHLNYLRLNYSSIKELYYKTLNIEKISLQEPHSQLPSVQKEFRDGFSLKFDRVGFGYGEPLFEKLSIELSPSDILVISGESGSGKSSLLSLVLGICSPTQGAITVAGEKIEKLVHKWRENIAYVGPEPFLFEGTIKDNLLYGHPQSEKILDKEIWNVLSLVRLEAFVKEAPGELNFVLEEQSAASTGQRQRISIARALLRKPKLLLLDEATANLDRVTEEEIMQDLKPLLQEVVTIIVTHKENLFSYGNKTIKL